MSMEYFHYCPKCKAEGIKTTEKELRRSALGTDGYGQPVQFTECECGSVLMGFLYLACYKRQGESLEEGFLGYLKHRIEFYYEGFKDNEESIRERYYRVEPKPTKEMIEKRLKELRERRK
ncbi:hypothetical protein M5X00_25880 [Paenibacillus alvei]|uniref:hypothetical protein n=1 Tax=Paenibacillus alvei TaxID=44250 RepID=UPI00228324CE|nr:hypothetical protein [Paenibacillus alvei]MCY9757660.1 hypothetical protein [Paenibacillus alvei]